DSFRDKARNKQRPGGFRQAGRREPEATGELGPSERATEQQRPHHPTCRWPQRGQGRRVDDVWASLHAQHDARISFTMSSNSYGNMALSQETACRLAWNSAVVASAAGPGPGPDRRGTGPSALRPQEVATHDGRPRGEIGVDDHEVRIVAGRDA